MFKKIKITLLLLFCFMFWIGAASGEALGATPKRGGTLTVALTATLETIDIQKSVMHPVARSVKAGVYEALVDYLGEEKYEPVLAESWEFKDDQTLVLYLRNGVKFHDGTTFDSEDVIFTIERMLDPERAAPDRAYVSIISEIIPLDKYTVQLTLSDPYGGILSNLDHIRILSKESSSASDSNPIGTGPFKFVEWIQGEHLILEKFDDYWQEDLPYLDKLVFKPIPDEMTRLVNLDSDVIQLIPEISPEHAIRLEKNKNTKIITGSPGNELRTAIFATDVPPMNNVLVRKAVAHCLNRKAFVDSVLYGYGRPTENFYSPENAYYNPDTESVHPYNLQKAKELFNEAGYPEKFPKDAYPLIMTIPAGNMVTEKAAVLLQSSLSEINIEAKIEKYDVPTWLRIRETKPMLFTYYTSGELDPSITLATNLTSQKKNICHYYNEELEQLISKGYSTINYEERRKVYYRIQELLIKEDVPFSVIACLPQLGVVSSYVEGFYFRKSQGTPVYTKTWLDK